MRTDRLHKAGGGLITLIRDNITFATTYIPSTINTHNTELQMVKVHINNTEHITIANIYIPPRYTTSTHYKTADTDIQHSIQYITNIPHSVLTGDVNAHSTLWHSYTDDHRGQLIADGISNSDLITLNTNTPTRVPNTTLQQTSSPDITKVSNTLHNRTSWTTQHALSSDHLPIITTINIRHDYRLQHSINEFLSPAKDQHGFRPRHSTTSALLQLTTDIETGFNQRKPPHRTVCVAIDLTTAFDTVSHDTLISKIVGSSLPPAITRWLSCYLRGRQAATSFRGTKSSTRIVRTGVPQGSKLSPSLFNYYIDDMPRPTPPVKRVCYADDITVWATGPKIPQLESMINNYLRDVSIYLKDNSLLISAPKSTVTFFTPDKHQFQMHPDIILEDTQLPLERSPKILGVIMDPSISFHKHCGYASDRIDKRNNMLKALAGSSWGQDKETLLMTYNALGKSIANYAAPVWSTNASDSSF